MKISLLFSVLFAFNFGGLYAQNLKIIVKNENGKNIKNLPITILNAKDSAQVAQLKTDSNGLAFFSGVVNEKYILTTDGDEYSQLVKNFMVTSNSNQLNLTLKKRNKVLSEVTVKAKKPLVKQEDDKLVVDPENIANTSASAYEVLEKTPGIFADQDGNFYISSASPAQIQINGRDMRLGAQDLANLLKNLPPNSILKIEVVRTPSAKNDAASSGGVINIILRKGVKLGKTGTVYGGFTQGKYGNQFMGISLSNNDDNISKYIYLGASNRRTYNKTNGNRILGIDSTIDQFSNAIFSGWSPYASGGISYASPNKKWDLSSDASISYNRNENETFNSNTIAKLNTNNKLVQNNNDIYNEGNNLNISVNLSSKFKKDSGRLEWTQDLSYGYFNNHNHQNYTNKFTIPANFIRNGEGTQDANRNLLTYRTDLVYKPRAVKKLTIETGIKTQILSFSNKANFTKDNNPDVYRTNSFSYDENINAAYLQASKGLEKFVLKAGVRLETTDMQGKQKIPNTQNFTIKRKGDFFPYVFLSRPVITIAGFELKSFLIFRKSITRPGYDFLNPFPRLVDNYLTEVGNPNLKPQFTTNFEANISADDRPIIAFGRNVTEGLFTSVIYQNPSNPAEALRTYDNLGKNIEHYFRIIGAIPPGGKYFFVIGAERNFNEYLGFYEGKPLNFKNNSWRFFTFHEFKASKTLNLNLFGFMQTRGMFQFYQLSDFGQLNLSANKKLLNDRLNINFSIRDILFTNKYNFKLNQGTVNAIGNRVEDSRRFGITLRYNFGMKKKEEQKDMFSVGGDAN